LACASATSHAYDALGSSMQIDAAPPLQPGWQFGLLLLPLTGQQ
jgi:hypothetical protein